MKQNIKNFNFFLLVTHYSWYKNTYIYYIYTCMCVFKTCSYIVDDTKINKLLIFFMCSFIDKIQIDEKNLSSS